MTAANVWLRSPPFPFGQPPNSFPQPLAKNKPGAQNASALPSNCARQGSAQKIFFPAGIKDFRILMNRIHPCGITAAWSDWPVPVNRTPWKKCAGMLAVGPTAPNQTRNN